MPSGDWYFHFCSKENESPTRSEVKTVPTTCTFWPRTLFFLWSQLTFSASTSDLLSAMAKTVVMKFSMCPPPLPRLPWMQGQLRSRQWTMSRSKGCHFWIEEVKISASAFALSFVTATLEAMWWDGGHTRWGPGAHGSKSPDEAPYLTFIRIYVCEVSFFCAKPLGCSGLLAITAQPVLSCQILSISHSYSLISSWKNSQCHPWFTFCLVSCSEWLLLYPQEDDPRGTDLSRSQWFFLALSETSLGLATWHCSGQEVIRKISRGTLGKALCTLKNKYMWRSHSFYISRFNGCGSDIWHLCSHYATMRLRQKPT